MEKTSKKRDRRNGVPYGQYTTHRALHTVLNYYNTESAHCQILNERS